ncbi:ATP-dependent helicase [Candidatus Pacearchaeota archaeon CG10_big_fil_rev_8_21_14_0_10_34_76]|nr:MAG: ATP-dependent helicase [Candidatus Pacearchaeota archaeon CG10_big_fil_rev_8_21_14_0_10_34_76]
MEKFKQLGLSEGILNAIDKAGFSEPSEIQEKTIPLVISGRDVIGSSATGSGKTLAFGAGIIDKVQRAGGIQALVLTPTRELAEQVAVNLRKFSFHKGLNVREIYGGVSMEPQIRGLRRAEIVVGTPGRILDHLKRRTLNLSKVRYLVLDEADRMLDMGFIRDVESIIRSCPDNRQTMLFSATISQEIKEISDRYMKNPSYVAVNNQVDPSKLYQVYYDVDPDMKFTLLAHLLKMEKEGVVMVFCNTRRNVDRLTKALHDQGIHARAIHGGLSQNKRSSTLQSFHERETLILVCTDVAARGLDIKDISHVYNFDIPVTDTDYIHRIGRTARAGKNGIAISFVSTGDHTEFRQISKSLNIERINTPKLNKTVSIIFSSNSDRKANRQRGRSPPGRGKGSERGRPGKRKEGRPRSNFRRR